MKRNKGTGVRSDLRPAVRIAATNSQDISKLGLTPSEAVQRPSGSNLTFESWMGFPVRYGRASLRDARWKISLRFVRGYSSAQSSGSRPQHGAEARLAG